MHYPLWAFFVLFILPPLTLNALLTGGARIEDRREIVLAQTAPATTAYWTHVQVN